MCVYLSICSFIDSVICVYLCIYLFIHLFVYLFIELCMYLTIYLSLSIYILYLCMYVCMYVCMNNKSVKACTFWCSAHRILSAQLKRRPALSQPQRHIQRGGREIGHPNSPIAQ